MAKPKKTAKPKAKLPLADVAAPGTTAPADTSKPIITPRPIMKDPMVVVAAPEDGEKSEQAPLNIPLSSRGETKIVPPGKPDTKTETDEAPVKDKKPETAVDKKPEEPVEPAKVDAKAAEPSEVTEASDNDTQPKKGQSAVGQTKEDARLEKLVNNKTYFLPINAVEQRRSKRFVGLGVFLALLLLVAWADVALDAGLVKVGDVKPVTHFFSN